MSEDIQPVLTFQCCWSFRGLFGYKAKPALSSCPSAWHLWVRAFWLCLPTKKPRIGRLCSHGHAGIMLKLLWLVCHIDVVDLEMKKWCVWCTWAPWIIRVFFLSLENILILKHRCLLWEWKLYTQFKTRQKTSKKCCLANPWSFHSFFLPWEEWKSLTLWSILKSPQWRSDL